MQEQVAQLVVQHVLINFNVQGVFMVILNTLQLTKLLNVLNGKLNDDF